MLTKEQKEIVLRVAYETAVAYNDPQTHLSLEEYFDDEMKGFLFDVFGNFLAALPFQEAIDFYKAKINDSEEAFPVFTHAPDSAARIKELEAELKTEKAAAKILAGALNDLGEEIGALKKNLRVA